MKNFNNGDRKEHGNTTIAAAASMHSFVIICAQQPHGG
jgi:hypothetical protein